MDFWLKEQSIKNRDKVAVTDGNHSITFKELYDKAFSISEQILSLNNLVFHQSILESQSNLCHQHKLLR